MSFVQRLPYILVVVGIVAILVGAPLYLLFGGLRSFALRPLQRCYDGVTTHETPQPGDVVLRYYTYRGLLLWTTQDEHAVAAPLVDAERLLSRLLRFNLTWGLMSYGALFIPLLALSNARLQRRSLGEQARKIAEAHSS